MEDKSPFMHKKNNDKYTKKIEKDGYLILREYLSKKKCTFYKKKLEAHHNKFAKSYANREINKNSLANKTNEKVVFNLHNKDLAWFKLFEDKKILNIISPLLKKGSYLNNEPFYLNNISARSPMKGNKGQQLHLDSNLAGSNYCMTMNVMWYLDDYNLQDGTTRIVPKSHKFQKYAKNGKRYKNEILLNGKAGDVLIFNGNLWHGGSSKSSDNTRWALILGYSRWFMKPSFDYMFNTPLNIFNKMTKSQKLLLGFNLIPPKDEFTRMRRISKKFERPFFNIAKKN